MSSAIEIRHDAPLLIMRIRRAEKKNALTAPMYKAMSEAIRAAADDPATRALVILGEPGIFSAGNDIQEFLGFAMGGALGREVIEFLHALADNAKPLIAGVDGGAVGVGTTLLLHCDYVVASERAQFSTPFVNLGLVPEAGSSLLGPRLMGQARAFEFFAMGRGFSPQKALQAGLINEIVPAGEADEAALKAAREIAGRPAEAVAITRALLRGDPAELHARIDEEARLFGERLRSEEARAAFTAFMSRSK